MKIQGQSRPSKRTCKPKMLTAFCIGRPSLEEVANVLHRLGFHLSFSLPPDKSDVSTTSTLPAQYHFEDRVGTYVIYLDGTDTPCLAGQIGSAQRSTTYRYPPHNSRFWLAPGGRELVASHVKDSLAAEWSLYWRELGNERSVKRIAQSRMANKNAALSIHPN